ncbi:MAG: C-terminal binding protein [Dehalococcoidia bacterium]|nr:C-terminal binding protein [Dehalococcoidia bacterium]
MSYKVVAFIRDLGWPIDKEGYKKLWAEYVEIPCKTEDEFVAATEYADAVLVPGEPMTRRIIERMKKCRIISVVGVGYDYVDIEAATEYGICVSNVPDYCAEEMTDHAMALLLACARRIVVAVEGVRAGEWDSLGKPRVFAKLPPIHRLQGQILGIVGLGRIGHKLAPKAKGFGMKVIAYDPYITKKVAQKLGVRLVEFSYLLERSDFISLHMTLNNETKHMFTLEQFKKMKPTAFFINVSRGGLCDEKALYTALSQKHIAGAGIDVTDPVEPPSLDSPLLKLDNVLITPHVGYYSEESIAEVMKRSEEEVLRVLGGQWPKNFVNPQVKENYLKRWKDGAK